MAVEPKENRTTAGILTMALAIVFFTGIDTSAKWLSIAGLVVFQIVFVRYLGHFIFALVYFLPREGLGCFRSNAPKRQFLRSSLLFISTILNFAAIGYLPITVTTTIQFAIPIATTLLAIPILGEVVGMRRIIAVCVGFTGVLVVMQPWGSGFHPAMLFNVGSVIIASLYFIMTRMLAGVESNATQQIWSSGLATIALAPMALPVWVWPSSGIDWAVMCVIGVFGALGHICATTAHRWADASILAPILYIQLFMVSFVGIFIFDTWPTVWTLSGAVIIIGSGLYIWQRERRLAMAR